MLLDNIEKSEGIVFIYSQYIGSGILPIMLALEQNGYKNYSKNIFDIDSENRNKNYIAITADQDISSNNQEEIKICTSYENRNGEKIKIILGNQVASEGLDLKNIRSIHIIDPWYHLKKMEQIIGRGIRYCSHKDLNDPEKNNVTVYLYSGIPEKIENSIDINIYNLAEKKNNDIVKVERILQENAIDVKLFKDINIPKKITEKCKLTIKKNMNSLDKNKLQNMYNIYEVYIKEYFKNNISSNIEDIKKYICKNTDTEYLNIELLYLTFKNMVKYKKILKNNGNNGYLIYINHNYIYQPIDNENIYMNIYERTNIDNIDKYTKLTIRKKIDKNIKFPDISNILKN